MVILRGEDAEKFEEFLENPPELSEDVVELMRRALERKEVDKPFEGVLGDSIELKLIEFLLPLEGMEFTISELSNEVGHDRNKMFETVEMLKEWKIIHKKWDGEIKYSLNVSSPIVCAINVINNSIIAMMIEKENVFKDVATKESK